MCPVVMLPGAHPRVRGEHGSGVQLWPGVRGSSPRARGAFDRPASAVMGAGLIPACAGSIRTRADHTRRTEAHPRVRGEHAMRCVTTSTGAGSSPRAREAFSEPSTQGVITRLIPACAGSIVGPDRRLGACGAHPRVRGEHLAGAFPQIKPLGSSPRARGAWVRERRHRHAVRLIPACAGSMRDPARGGRCRGGSSPRARGA